MPGEMETCPWELCAAGGQRRGSGSAGTRVGALLSPSSSDTGINSEGGPAPALGAQRARSNNSPLIPWQGHLISLRQRAK